MGWFFPTWPKNASPMLWWVFIRFSKGHYHCDLLSIFCHWLSNLPIKQCIMQRWQSIKRVIIGQARKRKCPLLRIWCLHLDSITHTPTVITNLTVHTFHKNSTRKGTNTIITNKISLPGPLSVQRSHADPAVILHWLLVPWAALSESWLVFPLILRFYLLTPILASAMYSALLPAQMYSISSQCLST